MSRAPRQAVRAGCPARRAGKPVGASAHRTRPLRTWAGILAAIFGLRRRPSMRRLSRRSPTGCRWWASRMPPCAAAPVGDDGLGPWQPFWRDTHIDAAAKRWGISRTAWLHVAAGERASSATPRSRASRAAFSASLNAASRRDQSLRLLRGHQRGLQGRAGTSAGPRPSSACRTIGMQPPCWITWVKRISLPGSTGRPAAAVAAAVPLA